MRKATLVDRLRYAFDHFMAKGTVALIGGLAVLSALLIAVTALVVKVAGIRPEGSTDDLSFLEAAWLGLMRTLDAGTMGGDAGWSFRLSSLVITLGGIFVISTLIGILTSGIEAKLERLRRGRSAVIERQHTVILGWSEQIFSIISELVLANANRKQGACVVVLADRDKVEMDEQIRDKVGDTGRTRIVCRSGSPIDLTDLEIASPHTARSIVILGPEGDDPDVYSIKTILALTNNPNRKTGPYHIVAEIRDRKNLAAARLVGKDEVELVLVSDLIARIVAQTCRQSGLSIVYTELLDFGGDEIYFHEEPSLVGKPFGDAIAAYEDSCVIGLHPKGKSPLLNPPMTTPIGPGDALIVISEDDDTIKLSRKTDLGVTEGAIRQTAPAPPPTEKTLVLGWNRRATAILQELDRYVASGSRVSVLADVAEAASEIAADCGALANLAVTFKSGDTTDRTTLDALDVASFDHIIVLSYADTLDVQKADARTLITLLQLRDISERLGRPLFIVSEMLDVRNRALAEVTKADDFIVSDRLVSLLLSQVSENKHLNAVFADIFDADGSEIYLKPAASYVAIGQPVNFYTVAESARRRGDIAIGYRLQAHAGDAARGYGVTVNPEKSKTVTFSAADRIIAIAES